MATLPNGKLVIGWSEFDTDAKSSWDIRLAVVSGTGIVQGTPVTLNDFAHMIKRASVSPPVQKALWPSGPRAVQTDPVWVLPPSPLPLME